MTKEQIVDGVPKILKNAQALLADANLLFEYKRFERAYSLYQLSIEEVAKAFLLIGTALFDDLSDSKVQNKINKGIKDHKYKTKKSVGLQSIITNILKKINIEKYEELVLDSFDELRDIDKSNDKKNWGFYTSMINGNFQVPQELISEEDTLKIKTKAGLRVSLGILLVSPMAINFDSIKRQINESNFDRNKSSKEQIDEFIRIKEKYKYP